MSAGGFFAAGAVVNLSATPSAGWQFTNFSGPASGATVTMDGPKSITANFAPSPTLLAVNVGSKVDANGLRLWNLRITNIGQGALANGQLSSIAITPIGSGAISLVTPLPIPLGNIPPGASVKFPVSFNWPLSTPPTRARMTFGFNGDFGHASTVTLNNLFRESRSMTMRAILLMMIVAMPSLGAPLLTIPGGATFNLTPNATFNLPFSITADANNYVVITGVSGVITRSPSEIYAITDVLSVFVSNNAYALAPGNSVWTETSTPLLAGTSAEAAGQFLVPANVTLGLATGNLFISYELYDLNPFLDSMAQGTGGGTLSATYSVNFTAGAEVPEPDTLALAAAGFAVFRVAIWRRRNRAAL